MAPISGVATDSRQVRPGDLFVAIVGRQHDGHAFLSAARQAGATVALVGRAAPECPPGLALIQVADPVAAMGMLAAHHRRRFDLPVVGITGSVGKTAVKDLTGGVLGQDYRVLLTEGNLNTEIGVPLTLFRLTERHQLAVLEMGMRGPGQIAALADMALPRVGVVTNVGEAHIEVLGSIERIANAKAELLAALPADGVAVVNADNPWTRKMADAHPGPILRFGYAPDAAVTARDLENRGEEGTRWRLVVRERGWPRRGLGRQGRDWPPGPAEQEINLPLPGRHQVENALAAAAVGLLFGMAPATIARGLETAPRTGMRLAIRRVAGITVIDDTYNASPASVLAALRTLREVAGSGRAIAVLGDMLELGSESEEAHRQVGTAGGGLQGLIALGDRAPDVAMAARAAGLLTATACRSPEAALAELATMVREGDTVLFKGSRAMRMERLLAAFLAGREGGSAS
jgi:UDP-N-acetylmuramoyl-tripeptide--D-alanyl-D-alanine ligase